MITFQNVQKVYEKDGQSLVALQDINLHINKGDIFGFIGYSGAGKSSLIRLVNQLEKPSSGAVIIDGQNIAHQTPAEIRAHKRSIGMIFQHFNLLETKTVAQNIAMPLVLLGLDKNEISQRVDSILEYVELSDKKINTQVNYLVGKNNAWVLPVPLSITHKFCCVMKPHLPLTRKRHAPSYSY